MPETENIALAIALAGYLPVGFAIKILWQALKDAIDREKAALREGIDIDKSYTAQVDSMSAVISSIQRTQHVAAKATKVGFDAIEAKMEIGFSKIVSEIQK